MKNTNHLFLRMLKPPTLFKLQMQRQKKKKLSRDHQSGFIDFCRAGKDYKTISTRPDIHQSTVREFVSKWRELGTVAHLPRSGLPPKRYLKMAQNLLQNMCWRKCFSIHYFSHVWRKNETYHKHQQTISTVFQTVEAKKKMDATTRKWFKIRCRITLEWFQKNKIHILEWPSQSPVSKQQFQPDINRIWLNCGSLYSSLYSLYGS